MFAYCLNNPVNRTDSNGNWSLGNLGKLLVGVAVIAVAAAVTVATGGAAAGPVVAAVHCAAAGALQGAAVGAAVGAATGAVSGAVEHRIKTGSWKGAGQAALDGACDGFMKGSITGAIEGAMTSPYCFIAGTIVLAGVGKVAIETVQAGDYVWAWDEETGDVRLKLVVETYVNETDELTHVWVNGEEIVSTPAHPFYSPVKGWTDAAKLRAGDILVLVNGEYVVVEKVQHELLESPVKVYNFQVADYHTYYVANSVLVHNDCTNPGGRHGGNAHRNKIQEVKDSLVDKGWDVSSAESRIPVGNGRYRYPDIIATKDGLTRYYQIGKATKAGVPVARELRALRDLGRVNPVFFVRYN